MILIAAGSFESAGANHELSDFWLDRTPVTVAAYRECVSSGSCVAQSSAEHGSEHCNYAAPERTEHPMNCVGWQDAVDYCSWAQKRLPSEWEWEWAARGRDEARTYPWGAEPPDETRMCSGRFSAMGAELGTCPVAGFSAGASLDGVLDLAGNVFEWTQSAPESSPERRILRGGEWMNADAAVMRADFRAYDEDPERQLPGIGFRCAKTPTPA
jgi:formylglycine-generating enzyme